MNVCQPRGLETSQCVLYGRNPAIGANHSPTQRKQHWFHQYTNEVNKLYSLIIFTALLSGVNGLNQSYLVELANTLCAATRDVMDAAVRRRVSDGHQPPTPHLILNLALSR